MLMVYNVHLLTRLFSTIFLNSRRITELFGLYSD